MSYLIDHYNISHVIMIDVVLRDHLLGCLLFSHDGEVDEFIETLDHTQNELNYYL